MIRPFLFYLELLPVFFKFLHLLLEGVLELFV
ncbi:MAG: hypothetical protein RL220_627, partial [Bacteroidota bacterium]